MFRLVVLLCLSYLVGSIPTSVIVGRVTRHIDIRNHGSGNAGATNAFRLLGWKAALMVLAVDVFKGWFAAAVISRWHFSEGADAQHFDPTLAALLCGVAAIIGHVYPVFVKFRGGKGVATLAGVLLYLFPLSVGLGIIVMICILALTGYVGLGSVATVLLLPVAAYFWYGSLNSWFGYFSIFIAAFITFTHRSNVSRLLAGTENRFEKIWLFKSRE
ncbi:MAG TPA: glycerol-3-phosphate 1-O-acyltransferase PlsY [Pyrinomonadaceae bacterium]|nr:glycerol-3-phosphate 1-O-acyltransferase PlsY [Pyrinomonadaceae bacterium]